MSEEWRSRYPKLEDAPINPATGKPHWPFLGYVSHMVDLALQRDDPEAFVGFMRQAGCDSDSLTFDNLPMERYCEKRGAVKCKEALSILKKQKEIRELSAELRA